MVRVVLIASVSLGACLMALPVKAGTTCIEAETFTSCNDTRTGDRYVGIRTSEDYEFGRLTQPEHGRHPSRTTTCQRIGAVTVCN